MTIITNTFLVFDAKGVREELSNLIALISPEDTPVLSGSRRGTVSNTLYEWQRDALAAASSANAQLQGDDIDNLTGFAAVTPTVRMGNRTQISRKTIIIADTLEATERAGRDREMAREISKRSAELKRDQEKTILENIGAVAGSSGVAPKTGTLGATVGSIDGTNVSMGATGTNPTDALLFTDPRNDGTQRPFTEALLKTVVQGVWTLGGSPDILSVGPFNKGVVSGFAGVATKTYFQEARRPAATIASADVYVSEFGNFSVVPNRFQRERDAWLLDLDAIRVVTLRPYKVVPLAKTGDAEKRLLIVEWGLAVDHEQRLGLVADLLTS